MKNKQKKEHASKKNQKFDFSRMHVLILPFSLITMLFFSIFFLGYFYWNKGDKTAFKFYTFMAETRFVYHLNDPKNSSQERIKTYNNQLATLLERQVQNHPNLPDIPDLDELNSVVENSKSGSKNPKQDMQFYNGQSSFTSKIENQQRAPEIKRTFGRNGELILHFSEYQKETEPLKPAPIKGFYKKTAKGILPSYSLDGIPPWKAYADSEVFSEYDQIALIVSNLGIDTELTEYAIKNLPKHVVLGFLAYAPDLQNWINKARTYGHEVILQIPMEPFGKSGFDFEYPMIKTSISEKENIEILKTYMGRASGYFSIMNYMGKKILKNEASIRPIFNTLSSHGMSFIHLGIKEDRALGKFINRFDLPYLLISDVLDRKIKQADIQVSFMNLIIQSRRKKTAIGVIAFPKIETITIIDKWSQSLTNRDVSLVPVSTLLRMKEKKSQVKQMKIETSDLEKQNQKLVHQNPKTDQNLILNQNIGKEPEIRSDLKSSEMQTERHIDNIQK